MQHFKHCWQFKEVEKKLQQSMKILHLNHDFETSSIKTLLNPWIRADGIKLVLFKLCKRLSIDMGELMIDSYNHVCLQIKKKNGIHVSRKPQN